MLREANVVKRFLASLGIVIGSALGGILVVGLGSGWCIVVDAGTFAIAGVIFAGLETGGAANARKSQRVWSELVEGWKEFRSRTWLWVVVAAFGVANGAFSGAVQVLGPVVADASIGRTYWGVVLASQTLGMMVGGVISLRVRPRYPLRAGMVFAASLALLPLALGLYPALGLLILAGFLAGFGLEQFEVAWSMTIQQQVPSDRLARAYSYDMLGSFLAIPVGQVAMGAIGSIIGIGPALASAAVVIVMALTVSLASRSVRDLTNS